MTSTPTACRPTTVLAGDIYCLDLECDHEHTAEGGPDGLEESYCDEVRQETVCAVHSRFQTAEDGFEELTHAVPWPCTQGAAVLPSSGA